MAVGRGGWIYVELRGGLLGLGLGLALTFSCEPQCAETSAIGDDEILLQPNQHHLRC